ncbi:hypothetical protein FQA39_LY18153 [Lamprigera yunnana]|nr:hypothetical protein FQA39_LY18153 [Lamprigera yunnana]
MFKLNLRSFYRYTVFGTCGGLIAGVVLSLRANDYQFNSIGILRLSRAASAVYDVALIYKKHLYQEGITSEHPEYDKIKSFCHTKAAQKLLDLCCTNKGVYIKVGQHIAALDYLVPEEYVKTMKILHSHAPRNKIEDIHKVLKEDLKKETFELFKEFDPEPLGSASLAQVHKATLHDGTVVAVKVQHHYVQGNSLVDMKTMETLVNLVSWVFPDFKFQWLVEETKKNIPQELNFFQEGKNGEKIAKAFQHYDWFKVPYIRWDLTTPRVLTMEYVDGGQVNDQNYIHKNNINPYEVTDKLALLYSEMIFLNGFVHSDPHPGNILVRKSEKGSCNIVLLDHGLYATLNDEFRVSYAKFWLSIINGDQKGMKIYSNKLGIHGDMYGLFACMVAGRTWSSIMQGIERRNQDVTKDKEKMQEVVPRFLPQISGILQNVNRQMLLILKTNDLIRGIEHNLDMDYLRTLAKRLEEQTKRTQTFKGDLETALQHRERWRSIYIIYFTMFLISLGFSIIITGVWPYLDKLDPTAGKEFMGFVVAANPLGQMLFSPLLGWWANRLDSIRIPVLTSLGVFIIFSSVYSSLDLIHYHTKYWMLASRFLVGVSSASIAACRSYLSAATRLNERTQAVSMISLAQVLGFVIGPAIQAAVVPLGDNGVWLIPGKLQLNMYTAAGWISVFLSIINFISFFPFFFKEHKIAIREAMMIHGKETEKEIWKDHKVDYLAAWTLLVAFFGLVFNFMLLETLGTPLTMDQFAWSKADALYYMGILMSVGAIIACLAFVAINPLCKYFNEAKVMLWGGFLFMVLGRILYIPWGSTTPETYDDSIVLSNVSCQSNIINETTTEFDINSSIDNFNITTTLLSESPNNEMVSIVSSFINETVLLNACNRTRKLLGCPSSQKWCAYTPVMTMSQFLIGYVLTALGYPVGVTLIQAIFSKVLGSRPQGVWMGLMTGSGCLSRVLGPVFVTYIYTKFGTIWTFSMTTAMMVILIIWLYCCLKRLIPFEEKLHNNNEIAEPQELGILVTIPLNDQK